MFTLLEAETSANPNSHSHLLYILTPWLPGARFFLRILHLSSFFRITPVLSGAFMRTLQNIVLPYTVSLKLIPSFQCANGIHGVDQSNTAGSIVWQCEAFDQDIVKIEFH